VLRYSTVQRAKGDSGKGIPYGRSESDKHGGASDLVGWPWHHSAELRRPIYDHCSASLVGIRVLAAAVVLDPNLALVSGWSR
jgi:hypothetical protein